MKKRIVLVGCSSQKAEHSAPAALLYTSDLFKKAIAYAKYLQLINQASHVLILSAKHGAIRPDQHIAPYDLKVTELSKIERHCWELNVRSRIEALGGAEGTTEEVELVWLPGKSYQLDVKRFHPHWSHSYPMEGLFVGQRKRWLKENTLVEPMVRTDDKGQLVWDWEKAA